MRRTIQLSFAFLLILLLVSCDSFLSADSPAYESINGSWTITMKSQKLPIKISAGKDFCNFDGIKYTGNWTGNSFSGSGSKSNYSFYLNLDYSPEKSISGSVTATVYYNGSSYNNTEYFTGSR